MKTFSYFIVFIAASFGISETIALYMSDILAYIVGFNITTILILITINQMERELAMEWWNELSFNDKVIILKKYNLYNKLVNPTNVINENKFTGREIEMFYKKEHKPIKI